METKTLGFLSRILNEAKKVLRGERKQESWGIPHLSPASPSLSHFPSSSSSSSLVFTRDYKNKIGTQEAFFNFTKLPFIVVYFSLPHLSSTLKSFSNRWMVTPVNI